MANAISKTNFLLSFFIFLTIVFIILLSILLGSVSEAKIKANDDRNKLFEINRKQLEILQTQKECD